MGAPSVTVRFISQQRPSFVVTPAAGKTGISVGDVRAAVHQHTGVSPRDWRVVREGRSLENDEMSLIESSTTPNETADVATNSTNSTSVFVLIRARVDRLSCETPPFLVRVRGLAATPSDRVSGQKRKGPNAPTHTSSPASTRQVIERTVKVSVTDSVRALKRRIARLGCCAYAADEQEIIFQGRKLDASCCLGDQLLLNGPIVRVVHRPSDTKRFPLTLKLGSSLAFRVPVTRRDTVAVLRRRLHRAYTFPENLTYALVTAQGIPMRSWRTIGHYALTGGAVVRIMFPPASRLRMNVAARSQHRARQECLKAMLHSISSTASPGGAAAGGVAAGVAALSSSSSDVALPTVEAGAAAVAGNQVLGSTSASDVSAVIGTKRRVLRSAQVASKRIRIDSDNNGSLNGAGPTAASSSSTASSSSSTVDNNATQGHTKRRCIDRTVAMVLKGASRSSPTIAAPGNAFQVLGKHDLFSDPDDHQSASQVLFTPESGGEGSAGELVECGERATSDSNAGGGLASGARRSRRCGASECRRKLPLGMDHPCRCGMLCCSRHMLDHQCSFDYKKAQEKLVRSELAMELSAKHRVVPKI
jgi:hypothetical protein